MKKTVLFTLLILPLLTCRDPTALLDKLEDDVKTANALYLEIVDVSPAENGQYINPGEDIRIEFDRPIDLSSVDDAFSVIDSDEVFFGSDSDTKTLSYSFDENTNILTIRANPYLDGLKQYTVSILDKIRGTDGSTLREAVEWSFSTSDAPRGYVEFVDDYTNDSTLEIHIYSQGATFYTIASSGGGIDWSTDNQLTGNPTVVSDFDISGSEGIKNVSVQFRDGYVGQAGIANLSAIETDSVVYDTTDPTVSIPAMVYGNIANPSPTLSPTAGDNLSGIGAYSWSVSGSASATSQNSSSTTISADEGTYDVTVTVTDRAGNSATSNTMTYTKDISAPTITSITSVPAYSSTYLDLGTNQKPVYTVSHPSDGGKIQFRLGNVTDVSYRLATYYWGSWEDYNASTNSPVVNYGYTHVQFRSIDAAGNSSSSTQFNYRVLPASGRFFPADSAVISPLWDLAVPRVTGASYYNAYFGTSSLKKGNPELILRDFLGNPATRYHPFIGIDELSLLFGTTYYWHIEAYNSLGTMIDSSDLHSIKTSKFKL